MEMECGADPLVSEVVSFVRGSRRGITRYKEERDAVDSANAELATLRR